MSKSKTCTDTFQFENHPFFEHIRKTLPDDKHRTQNLIECKDDVLFAWDSKNCCILTWNWRAAQTKSTIGDVKFQVWSDEKF